MPKQLGAIRRTARRVVRLALLGLALALIVLGLAARSAVASARSSMLELGQNVSVLVEARSGAAPRSVVLNGQSLRFDVTTTDQSVPTVLDAYEAWCRERDGGSSWLDLTLRDDRDGEGFVACLATGLLDVSPADMVERVRRYDLSRNLADLGQFKYVYATRGTVGTRVVTVASEGDFYLERMFPAQGDAPGHDVAGIPRPPSGRRMLSAHESGFDETLTVYVEGHDAVGSLRTFYLTAFATQQWTVLADNSSGPGAHTFLVQRGAELRAVGLGTNDDGTSFVSIADAPLGKEPR